MAQQYSLDAQARTVIGKKVRFLRREGLIPAVIYGAGGDPIHVSVPQRPLEIVLSKAGGTHLINVAIDGSTHATIVRAVQRDVIRRDITHVDFLRVDLSKTLRTEVPIVLTALPKLDSTLQLQQNITSIEVECLPTNIPEHIEVNAAGLVTLGAHVTVGDLAPIEGVQFLADPTEVIVRIASIATSEDEETGEATIAEPEVMEKGKKEEEDF